jgi:hypothetical protein
VVVIKKKKTNRKRDKKRKLCLVGRELNSMSSSSY